MNTDGTGCNILESLVGGASSGVSPYGHLTLSSNGSTLYGTTVLGGASGLGTVFSTRIESNQKTPGGRTKKAKR